MRGLPGHVAASEYMPCAPYFSAMTTSTASLIEPMYGGRWTQKHLAEAAGLSGRTIQRAERDEELSAEAMQALAAVFDITVADLHRTWLTEEEVREALEEAVAGLSEEQEDEIAIWRSY